MALLCAFAPLRDAFILVGSVRYIVAYDYSMAPSGFYNLTLYAAIIMETDRSTSPAIRKRNNRYLALFWGAIAVIVGMMIWATVTNVLNGRLTSGVAGIMVSIPLAIAYAIVRYRQIRTRTGQLLRQPSPAGLIAEYRRNMRMTPHAELYRAFFAGMFQAYYGEFYKARGYLTSVDWESAPPAVGGMREYLAAMLDYLEHHEFDEGLAHARRAKQMADVSPIFPGRKQGLALSDAYVLTGEIMTGKRGPEAVASLEACFELLPRIYQVFVAWSLGTVHAAAGNREGAEKMRLFLQEHAPYCTGLTLAGSQG